MEKTFNNNQNIISELINLIIYNKLSFENEFPLNVEKSYKELCLLNKKRNFLNSNKDIKIDNCKAKINYLNKINQINKIGIKKIRKRKKLSKIKNNYNTIFKINSNFNNNSYEIEKSDIFNINNLNLKEEKLNNTTDKAISKEISKKNNNSSKKNNNSKNISSIDFSNEIKVKKNNKMIFTNKYIIESKKKEKPIKISKNRGSSYRGVTKNGNKWQTILSFNNKSEYYGVYETPDIAARVHDVIAIKKRGIKAKTNFKYNIHQIHQIYEAKIDFKSKNIDEILLNLIKE